MSLEDGPSDKAIDEAMQIMADLLNEAHPDLHFALWPLGKPIPADAVVQPGRPTFIFLGASGESSG
jgi:hypothetical protein